MNNLFFKYRPFLLSLFIVTLVGGSSLLEFKLFGVDLYALRVFLILAIGFLFFSKKLVFFSGKATQYTLYLLLAWLLYACVSLIWCIDMTSACKDIMYLLFGLSIFVFLVSIKNGFADFENELRNTWLMVFCVVLLVSVWEIYTANHLVSNFTDRLLELEPLHSLNFVPVFTFDNPNHYAIYVCLSAALFFYFFMKDGKRPMLLFFTGCCIFLIHLLSARLGLITYFMYAILILFFYLRIRRDLNYIAITRYFVKFTIVTAFLIVGVFATNKVVNVYEETLKTTVLPPDDRLPSGVIRKNLIMNGYDFFIESKMMGVGAGNYKSYIQQGKGKYPTDSIDSPHNWMIEIFAEYGILIGGLFLLWLFYILRIVYASVKRNGYEWKQLLVLLLFFCYLIMSNSNSIFMPLPVNWFMFSLLALFADDLFENKRKQHV